MVVVFVYDASSCTVFNMENESMPGFFKQELGRCIVDLSPLHLSKDLRWVVAKLKRLGCTDPKQVKQVVETIAHGLRTKEHISLEFTPKRYTPEGLVLMMRKYQCGRNFFLLDAGDVSAYPSCEGYFKIRNLEEDNLSSWENDVVVNKDFAARESVTLGELYTHLRRHRPSRYQLNMLGSSAWQ